MPGACAAPNCKYNTRKLHVFRFPRDVRRCNQWLINCNRTDLLEKSPKYVNSRCRLCEKHFEDDQFMNASKSRLIWRAIPTIFDTSDPPESEKRRKFKHSFLSAKRKRISTLDQSCSADHTYFAALDKSARTKRMKTDVPDPETHPELTVCDLSRNTTFGLIDTRNNTNIANLYEYSGHETTAFIAVNTTASDVAGSVDINNMTSYCDSSSVRAILRPTQGASITGTNVTFQNTSRDVTFLTDGNIFPNSGVVGEFNANTNVIMFYNTSIRDEAIQDNGCSTANMDFEDLSNTIVPGMKFQEELKDGTSEGSMVANSGVAVPLNTRLIAFCDSSSNDETLVTMQSMLPEMTGSVQHTTLGSQMYTTSADIPSAVDYATAAAGTICESSRSATVSSRKRKRRKVAASEMAAGSVDHTYATNVLQKSFQGEGDCSCESFSKEQGMMLVQKILSMQKEALVAAKHSKTKPEIPTVESIVQGAIQLGMKDSTSRFFASQLKNCVRNNKGHRWSALDKTFARDLFVKSREAYKVLEDFFYLPSAATLQRHARGLNTAGSCFEHSDET